MRGYRVLRTSGRLALLRQVRADTMNTPVDRVRGRASAFVFGAAHAEAELATRQYLFRRIGEGRLARAVVRAIGGGGAVVHPLPRAWQQLLEQRGLPVARVRCTLRWSGYVLLFWAYGVMSIAGQIREALRGRAGRQERRPYAYFLDLAAANLPQPCRDGRSHDVISWYAAWDGRAPDVHAARHGVAGVAAPPAGGWLPVQHAASPIPPPDTARGLLRFGGWGIAAALLALADVLRGRWWHAVMLSEAAAAAAVRAGEAEALARDYLFHNSSHIYRPLWTYDAAARGSRILFYFYSTSEQFRLPHGYEPDRDEWGAMNWPHYLVWDGYQEGVIRRAVGETPRVDVTGPIWFQTGAVEVPALPPRTVAVFDIQPLRASWYVGATTIIDLYTPFPRTIVRFLSDIECVLREANGHMAHKRKRALGSKLPHPAYRACLARLGASPAVIPIDPATSPIRLVEHCDAVISMPFTSTAMIGRDAGKPSVYYDPLSVVAKDDRGAHGIPVVSGIEELRAWVARTLVRSSASIAPMERARAAR